MDKRGFNPLRRLFRGDVRRDVEDELTFHLEMRMRELIEQGVDPEEARSQTMARFGDVDSPRREMLMITERRERRMARLDWLDDLRQDVGYALRMLRRTPAFTSIAVLTLALGIGANSAIFSVVHAVLLESLPLKEPAQLAVVRTAYPNGEDYPLSAPDFMSIHDDQRGVFSDVVAYSDGMMTVIGLGDPVEIASARVSRDYFEVLGVTPAVGRLFTAEDHTPGRSDLLVVSNGFWKQQLGESRDAIGRTLTIVGRPYTIVGVLPENRQFPAAAQLFMPIAYDSSVNSVTSFTRRGEWLNVIGRLRPQINAAAGEREVKRIGSALQRSFPATNNNLTFTAKPLTETMTGEVKTPLLILLGAVSLVLLVACANVANLLLARATARESELAVRAALGAGRTRLVRQLFTESIVLAGTSALLGLGLAWWGTRLLVRAKPVELPRIDNVSIDGTVILFTIGVALFTGLLFGMLPALQATGKRLSQSLREGGRGAFSGVRGRHIRSALVVAEMAVAVMLMMGAGLLIRSFIELTHVSPGFDPDRALSFRVSLQGPKYQDPATRQQFFDQLMSQLRALPGVSSIGGATGLPLTGNASMFNFAVEGKEPPQGVYPEIRAITVTPTYFEAIGARLLRGRMLTEQDRIDAPPVLLVNRAAIARWFPDGDPVGERVVIDRTYEVVGVIEDVLQTTPGEAPEPEVYSAYAQRPTRTLRLVLRTPSAAESLAPRIRELVRAQDPNLPMDAITPLTEVVAAAVARPRFYTTLLGLFAGLALTLAVGGIFGVMSYIVAQRRREISVRMALGAEPGRVIRMVAGDGLRLALIGLLIGLAGAISLGGVIRSQLYGVSAADPLTIAAVLIALLGTAGAASYLPARRAARVDPAMALRDA